MKSRPIEGENIMSGLLIELSSGIIKAGIAIIAMLLVVVLLEKVFHPNEGAEWIATRVKRNIEVIVEIFWGKTKLRHIFDATLIEDMKSVANAYREPTFEVVFGVYNENDVPCFDIAFVPKRGLNDLDFQAVTDLLLLKYRDYLTMSNLQFQSFAVYQILQQRLHVKIYYAEFNNEVPALMKCYQTAIARVVGRDYGCLHDEDLDRELNNVS